jgi:hypothetical protein
MNNDRANKPAFIKIQDTIVNLTNCVSFKLAESESEDPPNTVLVETPLKVHVFVHSLPVQAEATMRQIERSIQDAGYKLPVVREG